jgi:hypothetical protein
MKMMPNWHWNRTGPAMHTVQQHKQWRIFVMELWYRFWGWFQSFDETNDDIPIVIKTAEDGARMGMVGWY